MTLVTQVLASKVQAGRILRSPGDSRDYLPLRLAQRRNEVFGCIYLTNRHRIIEIAELFQRTIDGASVR